MKLATPIKDECIVFEHKQTKCRVNLKQIKDGLTLAVVQNASEEPKFSFFEYRTMTKSEYYFRDIPVSDDFNILIVDGDGLCL